MPRVTFMPDDIAVHVKSGESLLRAAMLADVQLTASCGGDGTCGKCRVVVERGAVDAVSSAKLSDVQLEQGSVLACMAKTVEDVTVRVPPESHPGSMPTHTASRRAANVILSAEDHSSRLPTRLHAPAVSKRLLELPAPTLSDNASDFTRVKRLLRREHGLAEIDTTLSALRQLPAAVRGDWRTTALVVQSDDAAGHVTRFEPGDTTGQQYAVAVDVGTTTVETELIDLRDGAVVANASEYNAQVSRGEDVISRIIVASQPEGLAELRTLATDTVAGLTTRLALDAGADIRDIAAYFVAGNTVMTHLLHGVSPAHIRNTPYVPAAMRFPWADASELGLPGGSGTQFIAMPCPASWLGGDIVSGVIAAGMPWSERLTLFIDVGTNGEIVLGTRDWMVACSCSAGPAFEGGGILHGMRATAGAIEQVRVDPETFEPMILTIGETKPLGICGSGLIDCVSELFMTGAIGRNGRLAEDLETPWLRTGERGAEYVVCLAEESGTGADIVVTEIDIENLMRAKAAIYAGINILMEAVEVDCEQIDEVVVAGGFGRYLDLERVMALGMVPEIPLAKFVFIGNSSLLGVRAMSTSRELLDTAYETARLLTYMELSVNAGFMDSYMSAMFFPHTDLKLFPRTETLLRERTLWKSVH